MAPTPPAHGVPIGMAARNQQMQRYANESGRSSSDSERRFTGANGGLIETDPQEIRQEMRPAPPPALVAAPPAFSHEPGAKPQKRPGLNAEMRRANSRLSVTTLSQLADAGKLVPTEPLQQAPQLRGKVIHRGVSVGLLWRIRDNVG